MTHIKLKKNVCLVKQKGRWTAGTWNPCYAGSVKLSSFSIHEEDRIMVCMQSYESVIIFMFPIQLVYIHGFCAHGKCVKQHVRKYCKTRLVYLISTSLSEWHKSSFCLWTGQGKTQAAEYLLRHWVSTNTLIFQMTAHASARYTLS